MRYTKHKDLEKVYIHQNLTPRQRQQRAVLVQEIKQRQLQGEKNLRIINGQIIIMREKVMLEQPEQINQ